MDKRVKVVLAVVLLVIVAAVLVWRFWPAAEVAPTASPEVAAQETADVTFDDEQNGTATQRVTVGENAAVIKVSFSYELQGDRRVITDIGSAVAENLSGWHRVDRAATVSEDEIQLVKDGGKAVVPVTYQASIGVGSESYDAIVMIDLTAD